MSELRLERVLPVARGRVFQAWSCAEQLAAWMGPTPDIQAREVEVDFREGGRYRLGFVEGDQTMKVVEGTYLAIEPPDRLVFTWVWREPQLGAGVETLVTVELSEHPQGTLLRLHHQRFDGAAARDLHKDGWRGTLIKLEAYCAGV